MTSSLLLPPALPKLWAPYTPPTPNTFTEQRVNDELQTLDENLFIKWVPTAYWNEKFKKFEGRYALMCWWLSDDKRRDWVRTGSHAPEDAFDLIGWFCEDIHKAASVPQDPASMLTTLKNLLGHMDTTREPAKVRMMQAAAKNVERKQKIKQEMLDMVADEASTQYFHTSKAARVFT